MRSGSEFDGYLMNLLVWPMEVLSIVCSEEPGTGWFLMHVLTTGMTVDCGHARKKGLVSALLPPVPVATWSSEEYPIDSADH